MNYAAILALSLLFLADYLAIVFWLMRTANQPQRTIRFSVRTLFVAMTVVAIHIALFAAFLSAHIE